MFQKFYESSMFSRFIKQLLSTEYIPSLNYVKEGDNLISGCHYIYNNEIIECLESGKLESTRIQTVTSSPTTTKRNFVSKVSWYDSLTHKELGNYLRYLRDRHNLDLMMYYNCYTGMEFDDIHLAAYNKHIIKVFSEQDPNSHIVSPNLIVGSSIIEKRTLSYDFGSSTRYRVVAIPAKYDVTYTIAVDSTVDILLRGVVYDNGLIRTYDPLHSLVSGSSECNRCQLKEYYADYLEHSLEKRPNSRFNEPFTYSIPLASAKKIFSANTELNDMIKRELYQREDNLYILLQIPKDCNSSIVVLEGDYTAKHHFCFPASPVNPNCHDFKNDSSNSNISLTTTPSKRSVYNLSLLNHNTGTCYAFSDRLVEYLLLNVVNSQEELSNNISKIQLSLIDLDSYTDYKNRILDKSALLGVWDSRIQELVMQLVRDNESSLDYVYDHDGNINKDVENLLSMKGVYRT